MKAAILTEPNKPLVLSDVEWGPLQYGQVSVKILASGICGAQLQEIRGEKGNHFPRLLGHEACGVATDTGPGVATVAKGDKVVCHWRKGDGIESDFPRVKVFGNWQTAGKITTFAEQSVLSENRVTKIPDDAPVELCALLGCGLSTALGVIEQEANLKMGESVLIIGCGGLGLNLIRVARMRRASMVACCDPFHSKLPAAEVAGANKATAGISLLSNLRFNVVIDTSGNADAIADGINLLAPSGRFIMVGQPESHIWINSGLRLFDGEGCTIKATQGGGFRPHMDIPRYYNLWKSGQLDLDGIITHRYPLEFINDGIEMVKNGNAGRVLITNDTY